MTDRELLELAAKAAGIVIDKSPYNGGGTRNTGFDCGGNAVLDWHNGKTWNPLTDDGDAFRLQVALRLELEFGYCFVNVGKSHGNDGQWHLARESALDLRAATRRAIVRAAAEIGKTM